MVIKMNDSDKEIDTEKEKSERRLDEIKETGSTVTHSPGGAIQCLTIIGQIEGHYLLGETAKTTKYEHIIPLLAGVEESPEIEGLLVILNTVGGDVEAGLAIAELIAGMKKPTVSLVLGGGHSIGVPLAVAAKRSFIVPSATMTIHPVRTNGLVVGVPQSFECLQKMQDRITDFIIRNSRIELDRLRELMLRTDEIATDVGSIIDGGDAVRLGLIDEVGGLSAALSWLHSQMKK
ncbi:MAG: ClpP family protease [Candidatus Flemingiibacterium sp.]